MLVNLDIKTPLQFLIEQFNISLMKSGDIIYIDIVKSNNIFFLLLFRLIGLKVQK